MGDVARGEMATRPRAWVESRLHEPSLKRLAAAFEIVQGGDVATLPGSTVMIVSSTPDVSGAMLDAAGPSLVAVARPGIGVDNVDLAAATERGVLVINTPSAPSESTAEHAVALLLGLAAGVVEGDRWVHGDRSAALSIGLELRGRTLGVVGLGRIGRRVAQICGPGLGMRVLGYDPFLDAPAVQALGVEPVPGLEALLAGSDAVSLHLPLTPQTRGSFDAAALARMKRGAILVNASRGQVVDEDALVDALRSGHLRGAALDVFHVEPPPPDHPLLALPNVVATPHIASRTDGGTAAMGEGVATQLLQLLRGERPEHLVNPEAWPGRAGANSA